MSTTTILPKNHLDDAMYRYPEKATMTMTKRQFQETMLATGGRVMACGSFWDIAGKVIAPSVYRVTMTQDK